MYNENTLNKFSREHRWIGVTFFLDLINGLSLTFKYMFSKSVTMQYPDREKWVPYPRHRGHHVLRRDENGENKCVACELCAKICPCNCITVVPYEDENGKRRPLVYDVDMARCLYCGLCEDSCPEEAIALGSVFEYSSYTSEELVVGRDSLLEMDGKTEYPGSVVKARYLPLAQSTVEAQESSGYDWWRFIHRKD
ncbi:NADH-quinone oxidoreductase subunit NuoI [Aromatoleum toluclasticum]|uniref:NADH-quinone oxidoreductase subunit NuoI n=1 Tax=Aromatoleum toluclasticum TaxID=92003 RepID=UPI00035CCB12|nr:NADH-quinone oxidoreductase subunit NuoI [Aromatoleum toluclasticum]MCC4118088.1 NADH-quinone oxidoreductase subunit NuoI [Aromatoleum toluclasticum]